MATEHEPVEICGAGPAGLAAAITIARAGGRAVVYERRPDVGMRFHGDFQGLENWTVEQDVLEEMESIGIAPSFDHVAFNEYCVFDAQARQYLCRSRKPLFYLVRRGPVEGSLDMALKDQAHALGVEIRFNARVDHLPNGGVAATGPHAADAIAAGYVGDSDMPNGAYSVLSDSLAPRGYAYLLVNAGRATIATCLFDDFHNERIYVDRTVAFFRRALGFEMEHPRRFGGAVHFSLPRMARQGSAHVAGEAAGFQDAAWGFGMRFAILSGHLAALSCLGDQASHCRTMWRRLVGLQKASIVNRLLYTRFGDRGYAALARRMSRADDGRVWMHRYARTRCWKSAFARTAWWAIRNRQANVACFKEGCDCTLCRCQREQRRDEAVAALKHAAY